MAKHRSLAGLSFALIIVGPVLPTLAGSDRLMEANHEANRLFLSTRALCGTEYVLAIDVTPAPRPGFAPVLGTSASPGSGHTIYLAMGGVTSKSNVRMTDTTQWQARIEFVAERARWISVGRDGTRGAWQPIAGGEVYAVNLAYRQGWESKIHELALLANLGRFAKSRRPTCLEMPAA